jgi:transcriptional regulator with XRE-family HTH domain
MAVRTNEVVRRRIAVLLADRGIKKQAFAKAAARAPSWVAMFLRGERPFPFERIDEVARFFQYTPETLVAPLTDEEVKRSSEALKEFRRPTRRLITFDEEETDGAQAKRRRLDEGPREASRKRGR